MANSKWAIIPPLKRKEALRQGITSGCLSVILGIAMHLVGLKLISSILILAGVCFIAASPFLFRHTIIRGYCPKCNRFISTVLKDQIRCPSCKNTIDTK